MSEQNEELIKNIEHYSYFLADQIGKGFSSTVYRGKNNKTGASVAIKVINLRKLSQKTMQQLLQSEIGIIKMLCHPNVLTCQNVYVTINNCYIVTQLCKGGDLASQIRKKGRLRGMEALKIMLEISRGYLHLSERDIIHRDIKPANILLHNGTAKIADFGFARIENSQGRKQKYNIGTPLYMSPESLNSNYYSKKSDIWSLGIVFYEILQGRTPWDPKNQKQLMEIIKEKKQILFRIAVRDELETLIKGCLNHDLNQRISIESIIETLEQMMNDMMKEDKSSVYRETLTRRAPHALSCRDLNISLNIKKSISDQPTKSKKTDQKEETSQKENQDMSKKPKQPTLNRNKTEISLEIPTSVQQASRKNHFMLKAGINFSRFIYKTFPRVQKMLASEEVKLSIQAEMLAALEFMINWLENSIKIKAQGTQMGLELFDKFMETRCYTKTLAVIEEYKDRYSNFGKKMKIYLANKQSISFISCKQQLKMCSQSIKRNLKKVDIVLAGAGGQNHNICVDFLISLTVLLESMEKQSLYNFAHTSFIEQIVETSPLPLGQAEIRELWKKKNQVCSL